MNLEHITNTYKAHKLLKHNWVAQPVRNENASDIYSWKIDSKNTKGYVEVSCETRIREGEWNSKPQNYYGGQINSTSLDFEVTRMVCKQLAKKLWINNLR